MINQKEYNDKKLIWKYWIQFAVLGKVKFFVLSDLHPKFWNCIEIFQSGILATNRMFPMNVAIIKLKLIQLLGKETRKLSFYMIQLPSAHSYEFPLEFTNYDR